METYSTNSYSEANSCTVPVLQAEGHPVTQQRIALHLPQSDAAVLLAALHRLLGERSHGAGAADLRLVTHHVSASIR